MIMIILVYEWKGEQISSGKLDPSGTRMGMDNTEP
eukprot:CAMPEP_0117429322 /NCGR_PEP_ID=MMETSP0758-20121206/8883_1 /TAXON_ID=63605 /ORGANISM="Percolomonas cosmopolitus, Strain AE-1 (ATCC 50343)" /LENGTH=34 /DNA_ID= /DNA_START= /DNA_END= /DNA_ORIENTATION=